MKFQTDTSLLRDAISKTLGFIEKKSIQSVSGQILLEANSDYLDIHANDTEISLKQKIRIKNDEKKTFCVNAKNFYEILRELPKGSVWFETNKDNVLKINSNNIFYSILLYEEDQFTRGKYSEENSPNYFKIKKEVLLNLINKSVHAISTDETRISLNGIYLKKENDKIRVVSTDGHRLSLIDEGVNSNIPASGIIIPKKGIMELRKICESIEVSEIELFIDETYLYLKINNQLEMTIRLIARDYPNYQAVLPKETKNVFSVDKKTFFDAVKRIKIMANEKTYGVKLSLHSNQMEIYANHPSFGEARETIPIDYNDSDIEIGLNAQYLLDSLSTFDDNKIFLEFNNQLSPIILKSKSNPDYMNMIMPLRL